jgi:N6-L-threonylcarbamoyladenine synthase
LIEYILSIESSCDDSSIAITDIESKALVFHRKISQELEHSAYGGVVPELASRLHAVALPNILKECEPYFKELKAIAVTNEPGLSVTLMEGVMMAKALAVSLKIPLMGIHHLKGHVYSLFIDKPEVLPMIVLLVSGGHTQIMQVNSFEDMSVIAASSDDSFGESFDKVAKMMGLGYPGGPIVESLAKHGDEKRFAFPIPLAKSPRMEFSYSGLKNAVRLEIEKQSVDGVLDISVQQDIAASFQKAATAHLIQKTKKYFKTHSVKGKTFAIVGGASANLYVREAFENLCEEFGLKVIFAPLEFCSDNAAMIGRAAIESYRAKSFVNSSELKVNPRAPL